MNVGSEPSRLDVVVVGAGFAGLYALHELRGMGLSVRVLEAGAGVGGTWYWNRYPGARCDIESLDYSYSFSPELEQEWEWSERYATQPEILRYLDHVADRFDLRRDIALDTRVVAAVFDEVESLWAITTAVGDEFLARFCVMATGCLSVPSAPDLAGLGDFAGRVFHTGRWPHEGVDFTGRRVGVIGTGSSAIQSIPVMAAQAGQLHVFQRTPNFSVPANNQPLDPQHVVEVKSEYPARRAAARQSISGVARAPHPVSALEATAQERFEQYEARWTMGGLAFIGSFLDVMVTSDANETAAEFVREKIRNTVHDPAVAEALLPRSYPLGTKRLCVDTDYYDTFNRPDVTLVDLRDEPFVEVTADGVRTTKDVYEIDDLVLATGFDAMTGALTNIDIRGAGGRSLRDSWADGPHTYLGLAVAGFPNLFVVTGPGSPSVLSNMVVSIEQHVEWIAACIGHLTSTGAAHIEATAEAQDGWTDHVRDLAGRTLFLKADSWYVGANIEGKPRVFMAYLGGVGSYRQHCDAVAANGYEGFAISQ